MTQPQQILALAAAAQSAAMTLIARMQVLYYVFTVEVYSCGRIVLKDMEKSTICCSHALRSCLCLLQFPLLWA